MIIGCRECIDEDNKISEEKKSEYDCEIVVY